MKKLALHWQILIGMALGTIWAFASSEMGWSKFTIDWIAPFGDIFINLLKLIAVPLVLFSILSGLASLPDIRGLGRMGAKTIFAYLATTLLAITIGLTLVNAIQPGKYVDIAQRTKNRIRYELWAAEQGQQLADGKCLVCDEANAELVAEVKAEGFNVELDASAASKLSTAKSRKRSGPLSFLVDMVPQNIFFSLNSNSLLLQIIFFAIFFGVTLMLVPKDTVQPLINLINATNEVFLKMVELIMKAAPIFVFALMAGVVSNIAGDEPAQVFEIFYGLGAYSLVVLGGLFIVAGLIYPFLMQTLVPRLGAFKFIKGMSAAQTLAFSTSSSAATLPVTMECVNDNLGVSNKISSFVLPIGATVNMDGTSLYQAVAAVFLAQYHLIDLPFSAQVVIALTAMLASIGTAGVPGAGVVMLMTVLMAVGLDPAWIVFILPVDRILDMCRTVVNVTGDAMVATAVAKTENEIEYKS